MSLLGKRLEGERVRLVAAGADEYRVVRASDGEAIGHVALATQGDALVVRELVIDAGHRGFGAGSEVAALVRDAAESAGRWRVVRACAPVGSGLAVYYWMRMGLRPVAGEADGGGLLLERELLTPGAASPPHPNPSLTLRARERARGEGEVSAPGEKLRRPPPRRAAGTGAD